MVLKPFTLLCNHHHHVIHWAACILQNWNSSIHWTLVYPSPDSLAASILLPVSINLTMLWTSHKQNYTVFVLLWLDISLSIMVTCVCERWIIKEAEHQRIDAFELWCWRILFRVPWTVRRSNQSILKEISPEYSLEGLMLKLKLQYFGHLIQIIWKLTHLKRPWCWERLRAGGEGDDRGLDG